MDIAVTLSGPLFTKKVDDVVARAIGAEVIAKLEERMERSARSGGPKATGRRRNTVTQNGTALTLEITSTRRPPRTTGRSWQGKNTAIIRSMAPNVLRKAARMIAEEL